MNVQDIIDLDVLQKVQDSFTKATGFATITVDFRGNPITKYSNFSSFCEKIRQSPKLYDTCLKCDAFGGLEASRREGVFIYRCHTGLIDFAVPILIKGRLIGSMLVGQVKASDEEDKNLEYITAESFDWRENQDILAELEKIPVMSHEKISAVADMMFHVINSMVEKDFSQYIQEELRAKDQQLLDQMKAQAELEKSLLTKQNQFFRLLVNPNFLFNVINTMSCFSIIEKAPKTQEVILTFSDMMKYLITSSDSLVTLEDELSYINLYLKLQKIRFGERMQVTIDIPKDLRTIQIPPMIMVSLLDNAIIHGLEPKEGNGTIIVRGFAQDEDFVFEVIDDGVGMPLEKINRLTSKAVMSDKDNQFKGIGFSHVNYSLKLLYGSEFQLQIAQNRSGGTTVRFRIPRASSGGISYV